ncbi:MAG: YbaN family protein [Candidatus Izemoplasmatales bacterium]
MKKYVYISLGSICLALGSLGIVLPLLPTTPFLLLSAFFYLRSSQRLYYWLLNHRLFGIYIYSYINFHAIDLKTKISALSLLWLSLTISIVLVNKLLVTLILLIIGLSVSLHILSLKTMSRDQMIKEKNVKQICSS